VNNPNSPDITLASPSSITSIAFNHKNPDHIAGGCYNGLVCKLYNKLLSSFHEKVIGMLDKEKKEDLLSNQGLKLLLKSVIMILSLI